MAGFPSYHVENSTSLGTFFEIIFLLDFLAHFIPTFPEHADDPNSKVINDTMRIFENYIRGEGVLDLMSLLPF